MTSIESSLEDSNIAEELAEQQRQISIAEFFEKNKQMLGFDSEARALVTTVKEAVDNSLDATEEAGIPPDIYIDIQEAGDYYRVIVEDNGPGITKAQIPNVFGKLLYGSRFHVREQSLPPDQRLLVRRDGDLDFLPIGVLCDAYLSSSGGTEQARIPDDIFVPSFNRESHEMTWEPVTHAIRHETEEPTYEITLAGGRTVEVTGNHCLFNVTSDGETTEVHAGDLEPGDPILVPKHLPNLAASSSEVNLLTQLSPEQVADHSLYVRGFAPETLTNESTEEAAGDLEVIQREPALDRLPADRDKTGMVPAEAVIELGLEEQAAEGELVFAPTEGPAVTMPVRSGLTRAVVDQLAEYLESGDRAASALQTTRDHESAASSTYRRLTESSDGATGQASVAPATSESALDILLPLICGQAPPDRQLPAFIFQTSPARQRQFLDALNQSAAGTRSDGWSYTTASETLARQLSVLWNMQGVVVTMEEHAASAGGDGSSPGRYRLSVAADEARRDGDWSATQLQNRGLEGTDMCHLPVVAVEETEPPEFVYDISVPGATGRDENFVVMNDGAISVKNSRGQQGIGISAAVLYAQLTSGKPARITSRTEGSSDANYFELIIDTESNEPEISADQSTSWERTHGTRIEMEMEANMRARKQLLRYITHTAIVNPHARLTFDEPNLEEPLRFERAENYDLPAETEEIRPHPHGVELGTLMKMLEATDSYSLSGFLQGEFTRVGGKTAGSVLGAFRDRYYGREMAWRPESSGGTEELAPVIEDAVSNKPADATAAFADRVTEKIQGEPRVAHHSIVEHVGAVADEIEAEFGTTFGDTVRENAVAAAWAGITSDLRRDVEVLVDEATSSRKDSTTIEGLAERLAAKFVERADGRHRLTHDELREFVRRSADDTEQFDEATIGETARENIVERFWSAMETVPDDPPKVRAIAADRDAASDLLEAMRATDIIAPPTDCLSPITAELIEAGLRKEFDADFYAAATREAEVHGGDPFIVEAGLAFGGELEEGTVDILRFANRVPLVYQRGACATTDVVKSINWRNYNLDQPGGSGIPDGPAVIMVHVASTNVPFTSESKDAIANIPAIEQEIERALREVGRDLKSYLNKRQSLQQRRKKQTVLATILPEMAKKVADVTGRAALDIDDSMARIMNNVLVARQVENGTVRLSIQNYSETNVSLEVTDIVSREPSDVEDATVVEMDGEWFVKWSPTISTGEDAVLEYSANGDASFELSVDGIENEKLTIQS